MYVAPLAALIEHFERLPGIGHKTAVRLSFSVLSGTEEEAKPESKAEQNVCRDVFSWKVTAFRAKYIGYKKYSTVSLLCQVAVWT